METKHTPGPWMAIKVGEKNDLQQWSVLAEKQPLTAKIKDICCVWLRGGTKKSEANARLIAAAPELLAVLLAIREDFDQKPYSSATSMSFELIFQMEAAIAKATGEIK